MTEQEFTAAANIYTGVRGKTIIDHRLRIKLDLSLIEYIIVDFIHLFSIVEPKVQFTDQDMWKATGMRFDGDTKQLMATLRTRGFIQIVASDKMYYLAGEPWTKNFDTDSDFEQFWTLWSGCKRGNKEVARAVYVRTIKIVDKDELTKYAKTYIDSLDDKGWSLHASTWLNPKNRHWENEIVKPKKKEDANAKKQFETF